MPLVRKRLDELTPLDYVLFWEERETILNNRTVRYPKGYYKYIYLGELDHHWYYQDTIEGNIITRNKYYYNGDSVIVLTD